jgi:hypothetical protein
MLTDSSDKSMRNRRWSRRSRIPQGVCGNPQSHATRVRAELEGVPVPLPAVHADEQRVRQTEHTVARVIMINKQALALFLFALLIRDLPSSL